MLSMDTSIGKLKPACKGVCRDNTAAHKISDEVLAADGQCSAQGNQELQLRTVHAKAE